MEEILASIRRMIADDDPKPSSVRKVMERELARTLDAETRPASETVRMPTRSPVERHLAPQKPTLATANLRDNNIVPLSGGEVLDLNESMESMPDPAVLPPVFRRPMPESRAESRETRAESKAARQNGADTLARQPFLAQSTVSAVESAFGALTSTVINSNSARTLDDLVKEMLRPMLKSWLDDNLPRLVERLVKAEIERVSRGM